MKATCLFGFCAAVILSNLSALGGVTIGGGIRYNGYFRNSDSGLRVDIYNSSFHDDLWSDNIIFYGLGSPKFVADFNGKFGFFEGDLITTITNQERDIGWAAGDESGTTDHVGRRGQTNFLGFSWYSDIDGITGRRYGFIQYTLDDDYHRQWIGYAYNNEVDTPIVAFDITPPPSCPDLDGNGELNFFDISLFVTAYASHTNDGDWNNDGEWNFSDVSEFISQFTAGCP